MKDKKSLLSTTPDYVAELLRRKAERQKSEMRRVPDRLMAEWAYRMLALMNLAWQYVETCINLAIQLRISELKPVSRRIRELKREYDRFRHGIVTDSVERMETERAERFEDTFGNDFKILFLGLDTEVAKLELDTDYRVLVVAVLQCLTLMDAVRIYEHRCEDAMRRDFGLDPIPDAMIQKEFLEAMKLIPEYAGDCYITDSPTRAACARAIANRLEIFPIPEILETI